MGENKMKICKDGRIWGQTNTDYHNPEYIKKQREAKLGKKNPNWKDGRTKPFVKKGYNLNSAGLPKDYRHSEKTKLKIGKAHKGEKSHLWKGGISLLHQVIRNLPEYRQWRSDIFQRDNWTCQTCGKRGGDINAHHIESFKNLLTEFLQEYDQFSPYEDKDTLVRLAFNWQPFWTANGITLCKECHKLTKNFGWKQNNKKGGEEKCLRKY